MNLKKPIVNRIIDNIHNVVKLIIFVVPIIVLGYASIWGMRLFVDSTTLVDLLKGVIIIPVCVVVATLWFFVMVEVLYG